MGCGARSVDNDIVEVGGGASRAFEYLLDHLDETTGGGVAEDGSSLATAMLSWKALA